MSRIRPTIDDVARLVSVLHRLVDEGHTVVVIEHNEDVILSADWVIDLGPEGGDGGGELVATGTPEELAGVAGSHTGRHLARVLESRRQRPRRSQQGGMAVETVS